MSEGEKQTGQRWVCGGGLVPETSRNQLHKFPRTKGSGNGVSLPDKCCSALKYGRGASRGRMMSQVSRKEKGNWARSILHLTRCEATGLACPCEFLAISSMVERHFMEMEVTGSTPV